MIPVSAQDVIDATGKLTEAIQRLRIVLEALKDGKKFMMLHHPEAVGDLTELLRDMKQTVVGLTDVANGVMSIDLTIDGSARDHAPDKFNDRLHEAMSQMAKHEQNIDDLHGSCKRMRRLRDKLNERAGNHPWWALLGDKAGQRSGELSSHFRVLFEDDMNMVDQLRFVLHACKEVLTETRAALTDPKNGAGMSVKNVHKAASILKQNQQILRPAVDQLTAQGREITDLILALEPDKVRLSKPTSLEL